MRGMAATESYSRKSFWEKNERERLPRFWIGGGGGRIPLCGSIAAMKYAQRGRESFRAFFTVMAGKKLWKPKQGEGGQKGVAALGLTKNSSGREG